MKSQIDTIVFLIHLVLHLATSAEIFNVKFDEQRIVNGTEVPLGKYPSQISLQHNSYHLCSGSIVSNEFVLTAAHCCHGVTSLENAQVVTSMVDLRRRGRNYNIVKMFVHPEYNVSDLLINDVCLIKVFPKFQLKNGEAKIRLPKFEQTIWSGSWATILGWGLTVPGGQISMVLKEADQIIINYQECSAIIGQIYSSQACCYFPTFGKGICEGDSGGPVLWHGAQLGIVSWRDGAKPCAASPAVFVQLAPYMTWINDHIRNNVQMLS